MNEAELAVETKARGVVSELTKEEGLKVLSLLLERSQPTEISDAIKLTKLSYEVDEIQRSL